MLQSFDEFVSTYAVVALAQWASLGAITSSLQLESSVLKPLWVYDTIAWCEAIFLLKLSSFAVIIAATFADRYRCIRVATSSYNAWTRWRWRNSLILSSAARYDSHAWYIACVWWLAYAGLGLNWNPASVYDLDESQSTVLCGTLPSTTSLKTGRRDSYVVVIERLGNLKVYMHFQANLMTILCYSSISSVSFLY